MIRKMCDEGRQCAGRYTEDGYRIGEGEMAAWKGLLAGFAAGAAVMTLIQLLWKLRRRRPEKEAEQEQEWFFDETTGIGNKQYFCRRFEGIAAELSRRRCCVLYIGFQIEKVNELYGENEAERRLLYAAGILKHMVGKPSILARVSGGGFGIVRPWRGSAEMESWMERVLKRLNQYDCICHRDAGTRFYGGVYRMDQECQNGEAALYCARQGYLHAVDKSLDYGIVSADMAAQDYERRELRRHYFQAIEDQEFKVFVQWIVDGKKQEIVGGEALSRWKHPQKGWLYPSSYIAWIESEKNTADLDYYMFEHACRLLEQWNGKGRKMCVSSNFTRITIGQPDFIRRICRICEKYDFPHENMILEITEDVMEINREYAFENISRCKKMGFLIALDDVGSGNASFSDLRNYPIDIIKIDCAVLHAAVDEPGITLLKGMIDLAHSLDMKVICEGVETREQRELVQRLKSDYMQGFLFGRAISMREANRILEEKDAETSSFSGDTWNDRAGAMED